MTGQIVAGVIATLVVTGIVALAVVHVRKSDGAATIKAEAQARSNEKSPTMSRYWGDMSTPAPRSTRPAGSTRSARSSGSSRSRSSDSGSSWSPAYMASSYDSGSSSSSSCSSDGGGGGGGCD